MQVLVIDDHPIVVEGCRHLLLESDVTAILHAQSLADGFRIYRRNKPRLILMDLAIGGKPHAGLSFIRRLRLVDAATPILILSMHHDPLVASQAVKLGANGYLVKDAPLEQIVKALTRVLEGKPYLSHQLAAEIAFLEARRRSTNPISSMSARELSVLSQLAEGRSYQQIASNLLISYKTVANVYARLKGKLGARSLPELMKIAAKHLPTTQAAIRHRPARTPREDIFTKTDRRR
jgi:DNA-binding NarL/FixJ family response regulator